MLPRAALLQLPVPDTRVTAARSNVPLAAGYLAAWSSAAGALPVSLPPRALQDHGGDEAILAWLEAEGPAVVGFTAFLWNIDRTLWLASALRDRMPGTLVVLGGPEIAPGHPLLEPETAPEVDTFVVGEGEEAWTDLVRALAREERPPRLMGSRAPLDASRLPNPYLAGSLPLAAGDPVFLETVRGCTRHCDYCYYAKASGSLRSLPNGHIPAVMALARERGVEDLYVMDPCFNASADFRDKLELLAACNPTRIPLHTELELEAVTPQVAELLARAGFVSVEAGLQSTNRDALRSVHRGWRKAEFLRGAELLREKRIAVRTGLILGLPRDTMEGFLGTIDFVKEHGLADGVEIYPLSVLPGTVVRARASELGLEYMARPPYWVLSNGSMREPDFIEAIEIAEAALDMDFFQPVLPSFVQPAPGIVGFRDLREPGSPSRFLEEVRARPERLASRLTLLVGGPAPREPATLEAIGGALAEASPHTLVVLVVDCERPPPYEPWDRIALSFFVPGHYFNQIHYYKRDRQDRFSARLVHLTGSEAVAERSYTDPEASAFDLLLRFAPVLLREGSVLERFPPLLVPEKLESGAREELDRLYRGLEGLLVREG